jgi:DNA helicase HerA-like ATPase
MKSRADLYHCIPAGRICNDLDRFNELNRELRLGLPELSPVLVVVDEVQDRIKHHKGAQALLERGAKLGRAYGVFLAPSTQLPKAEALPTEIKAECYPRFVAMLASPRLYGVIAEVPEEVYSAHPLREHQFYVRLGPRGGRR